MVYKAWSDHRDIHFIKSFWSPDLEPHFSCGPVLGILATQGIFVIMVAVVLVVYIPPQADTDWVTVWHNQQYGKKCTQRLLSL